MKYSIERNPTCSSCKISPFKNERRREINLLDSKSETRFSKIIEREKHVRGKKRKEKNRVRLFARRRFSLIGVNECNDRGGLTRRFSY